MRSLAILAAAALVAAAPALLAATDALAQGRGPGAGPRAGTVVVEGTGVATAAPDLARISAGVSTVADTATAALSENSRAMAAVLEALAEAGVAERDRQTSNFSIVPVMRGEYGSDDGEQPRIVAYRVDNDVFVTVRDLARLGELLDTLVRTGANQIGSISFGVADETALADDARRAAVADARRKAELYAAAAGITLGRLIRIDDLARPSPRPMMMARAAAMDAAEAVPIATGALTATASVRMAWRIGGPNE